MKHAILLLALVVAGCTSRTELRIDSKPKTPEPEYWTFEHDNRQYYVKTTGKHPSVWTFGDKGERLGIDVAERIPETHQPDGSLCKKAKCHHCGKFVCIDDTFH